MPHYDDICIRFYSDLIPCPWSKHIPLLKLVRERLRVETKSLDLPLPEYLIDAIKFCEGCRHYDPVWVYRLGVGALN